MKTYKTWEMIKELTENPEKEFIRARDGLVMRTDERGYLRWEEGHNWINLGDDWEEVKKPVDFLKAVVALDEGKTIYVETYADATYVFSPVGQQNGWGVSIKEQYGNPISTELILYGKWYIED